MAKASERRDKIFDEAFEKRLRNALSEREISACAAATEINQSTLHRWMLEAPRQFGDIKRVAEYCSVSPAELVFGISGISAEDEGALEILRANPALDVIVRELSASASRDAALAECLRELPEKSVLEAGLVGLKDHLATLVVGSKEYQACLAAAALLDQINAALPAISKLGSRKAAFSKKPVTQGVLFPPDKGLLA